MATTTHQTFCRFCHANCAIEVDVENGRPVQVRGDTGDPVFGGYTCLKGRELPRQWNHPSRLLRSQKRQGDGTFAPIAPVQLYDEVAARLRRIVDAHGPRAVAVYSGTYAFLNSAPMFVAAGFLKGLGSPSHFTSVTIDQPAKVYTWARVGQWMGGTHCFKSADVTMIIGHNPLTSHFAPPGSLPPFSPSRRLRDAIARGLKLIVIDPRRTPTAKLAHLHLQVRPGEDPTLLAGLLRVILAEGRHDAAFCERWVEGLDALREAIEPFTPEYVARRADVPAADVVEAARLFAQGPRGIAATGTGPEMAPRGTLTEHLVIALNTVCGRVNREGEESPIARVLSPVTPRKAQVMPPMALWGEHFPRSRVRGLTALGEELPTTTAADEMLLEGEGRVRALICVGGNPIVAWPNQEKVERALSSLDLLVSMDVRMSQTARMAHYVLAPKICLEREDITHLAEWWLQEPYARYAETVVEPPPGSDLVDEWEFFWEVARRLRTPIPLQGGPLPMDRKPQKFEVLDLVTKGCRVPLAQIRARNAKGERHFPEATAYVEPPDPEAAGRLQLAPAGVPGELRAVANEPLASDGRPVTTFAPTHLVIGRRSQQFYNSTGHELEALRAKGVTNYAYLHPDDLARLGVADGGLLEIASSHATILGVARSTEDVKPGVISMSHAFGDVCVDPDTVRAKGATTNRLVSDEVEFDPITGQCRQSAIAVRVRAAGHCSP